MWGRINEILTEHVLQFLCKNRNESEENMEILRYGMLSILSESEKIILMMVIFSLIHCGEAFVGCFMILTSIRIFAGGSHRETMLGCFLQSLLTMGGIIFLANYIRVCWEMICIMAIGLGTIIVKKAPIVSNRRENYSEWRRIIFRKRALFFVVVWTVFAICAGGVWASRVLCCLAVQLFEMYYLTFFSTAIIRKKRK